MKSRPPRLLRPRRWPRPAKPVTPTVSMEPLETRTFLSVSLADLNLAALRTGAARPAVSAADHGDKSDKEAEKAQKAQDKAAKKAQKEAEKRAKQAANGQDNNGGDNGGGGGGIIGNILSPPVAQVSAGDVTSASSAAQTITVVYTDDKGVRANTIGKDDIVVASPGGANLTVTGVSVSPASDASRVVATYSVAAPGGRWDPADNGAYTVTLKPLQVFDTIFLPAASVSANFQVGVTIVDNGAPTADIAVENITAGGGGDHNAVVAYHDDVAINLQSIGPGDITIAGPDGSPRPVRSVSLSANSDATRVTATYTFGAPGAVWDNTDNGTYAVSINPNQVRDTSDKGATATPVSFTVNVPRPEPVDSGFGGGTGGSSGGSTGGSSGGSGGTVRPTFVAEAVVAQGDGKIVIAGRQGNLSTGSSQAVLQRFNPDGTPDTSFGVKGKVVTAAGGNDAYYAIALNAAGQVFVSGTHGGDVLVSRYTAAGKLDTAYGKGGSVTTDFGTPDDAAYALGVTADGSVVIAAGPGGNFGIARYRPAGTLDPSFASGGVQMFDLGSADDVPGAVAFQGDKVVVVGTSGGKVAVVRLKANGEADPTFSGDGLLLLGALSARTDANFADRSTAAAVQADGKLLLANRSAAGDFAVARLNLNGSLDTTFGDKGVRTVDFGGDDDADAVLVQDTGEILVIGTTTAGGSASTAVAALSPKGDLIGDFGTGGKLTLSADVTSTARELHVGDLVLRAFGARQSDGRLVVGTSNGSQVVGGSSSSLRRLNVPGTRSQPLGTSVGTFGTVDGRRTTLSFTDADGTKVTFAATRGTGSVYLSGGHYNVTLSDGVGGASMSVKTSGGDGRVSLGDVTVSGMLQSLSAKSADLAGTLYASGPIGKLVLGNVSGIIASAGAITSVSVSSLKGARIMSAASLGADAKLGGDGADADSFDAGSIGTVRVAGPIEASEISAGLDPVDGVFNNADDKVIGGPASLIRSVTARSADENTVFVAGKIGSLRLPGSVDLTADSRVKLLA